MRVLVAPGLLGLLGPVEAAAVVAEAWRSAAPHDEVVAAPLSDGGPGFVDAVRSTVGGELLAVPTTSPGGSPVPGAVLLADDGRTAYVESAHAAGLGPAAAAADPAADPAVGTSAGVGTLLLAALRAGARRVVVGVGGAAAVDAGAGMLVALGLPDARGLLRGGAAHLGAVEGADLDGLGALRERLTGVELIAAVDVDRPLLGLQGAAASAADTLGLGAEQTQALERHVAHLAHLAVDALGDAEQPDLLRGTRPVARLTSAPGAGAGGGVAFGLSLLGARLVPGARLVAEVTGLADRTAAADVVVTGVGRLDWRALDGTVVAEVAREGLAHGVPMVVLAEEVTVGRREQAAAGITAAYAFGGPGDAGPAELLDRRVRRVARTWSPPPA